MRQIAGASLGSLGPLLLVAGLIVGDQCVAETRIANSVVITRAVDDDLYAAGGEVRVEGSVGGAAVLGAGSVQIPGDVAGDAILAGGRISLEGGVGDDLRAAGGDVRITGFITDQAVIAGGAVTIGAGSAIGGRTWIAAGDLEMAGQIGDDLRVAAGTVVISGRVAGNVEVAARKIRVEPGAVIGGDLVWRSREPPSIAESAQILGEVREAGSGDAQTFGDYQPSGFRGSWAFGLAVAVASLMLLWFAPQLVDRSASAFRAAPGRTLLLGAASLVLTPILAFFLFVTLLGWLLGLVVLAGYVFGLMLSGLVGLLIVVQILRGRFAPATAGGWRSLLLIVLVVIVLGVAQQLPVIGTSLSVLLVLAGLGALMALVTGRASGGS